MQVSKLVCKKVEATKFTGLLGSGYAMVVGNYQYNAANLKQSKPQFQMELSSSQFSPSLLRLLSQLKYKVLTRGLSLTIFPTDIPSK